MKEKKLKVKDIKVLLEVLNIHLRSGYTGGYVSGSETEYGLVYSVIPKKKGTLNNDITRNQ